MDEGTLNDLLECSVCFDRLDTSSKVLPCQHTFCRKCLHDIVQKHKELRCPECRILVTIKVEELPPNVLLMRILEGMRNAVPKKQIKTVKSNIQAPTAAAVHQATATPVHQHGTPDRKANSKQLSPHIVPHQPYAKAIYDFEPKEAGDLSFKRGDVIFLKKRVDTHWYQGECGGKQGLFPVSYVQIITPLPSLVPQCKALYPFQTDKHEEEGCLVFKEGDIITVIRRVDENWAEGKLDGRIGIFPLTFVEMNNLARSLMKLSTNAQPGPSRVAPPTPTTEDSSTPLIPTDHSRTVVPQQPLNVQFVQQNLATSDSSSTISSGSSSTTTPNISSSNTSSNSSTAPSSPASPPARSQPAHSRALLPNAGASGPPQRSPSTHHQHNKEKRHSFTSSTPVNSNKTTHRHSAEIFPADSSHKLPAPYIAIYPYKPQKSDELELRKGGIYTVSERCQDGWFKGTSNRTQKCGVFPGNYVAYTGKHLAAGDKDRQSKERKEKGSGGLMRRLASIKRSKSPPPTYSMDNPVFEDSVSVATPTVHPVHVRSGSCPSQLLQQIMPSGEHHRLFGSTSQRLKHKERPSVLAHNLRSVENPGGSSSSSPDIHHHRKSNSLDAGNRLSKTSVQTVNELFRCEIPYPPLSEYELELQKGDLIYVHKKREDGWYKGTLQRNRRTGLFPASFVKPVK